MGLFSWLFGKKTYPQKDLSEPIFDVPNQDLIKVEFKVENLPSKIYGQTKSSGDKLTIRISPLFTLNAYPNNDASLLECIQHELFHCFLWHTSYTHSNDKLSMLYYQVYGKNLIPVTEWDLKTIKEISQSINKLEIKISFDKDSHKKIYSAIYTACVNWNKFLGRKVIYLIT